MDDTKSDAAQQAHDDVIVAEEGVVEAKGVQVESMKAEAEVAKDELAEEAKTVKAEKAI